MNNIHLIINNERVGIKFITFSDGAENCVLPPIRENYVVISVPIEDCTRDMMRILLVKEALDSMRINKVSLFIPYMPNARCDRRFSEGEAFPLKVFTTLINSCNFHEVTILDPHSEVSVALLDRVEVSSQKYCFNNMKTRIQKSIGTEYVVCAPDLGASKKAEEIAHMMSKPLVQASKRRDLSTGKIVGTSVTVPPELKDKQFLIVDDICDGGATFSYLADELHKQGVTNVSLYVTHGIFAKGLEPLRNLRKIFVGNLNERYVNIRDIQLFNERQNEPI